MVIITTFSWTYSPLYCLRPLTAFQHNGSQPFWLVAPYNNATEERENCLIYFIQRSNNQEKKQSYINVIREVQLCGFCHSLSLSVPTHLFIHPEFGTTTLQDPSRTNIVVEHFLEAELAVGAESKPLVELNVSGRARKSAIWLSEKIKPSNKAHSSFYPDRKCCGHLWIKKSLLFTSIIWPDFPRRPLTSASSASDLHFSSYR